MTTELLAAKGQEDIAASFQCKLLASQTVHFQRDFFAINAKAMEHKPQRGADIKDTALCCVSSLTC